MTNEELPYLAGRLGRLGFEWVCERQAGGPVCASEVIQHPPRRVGGYS